MRCKEPPDDLSRGRSAPRREPAARTAPPRRNTKGQTVTEPPTAAKELFPVPRQVWGHGHERDPAHEAKLRQKCLFLNRSDGRAEDGALSSWGYGTLCWVQNGIFATKKPPRDLHNGEQLSQNAAPPEGRGAGDAAVRQESRFVNFHRDHCDHFHARSFPEKHALSHFHGLQPPARLCSKYSCANFNFQTILELGLKPVPAAAREQSRKATEKPASKAGGAAPLPPAPPALFFSNSSSQRLFQEKS